jgi:trehalose 2-sulfotransferase
MTTTRSGARDQARPASRLAEITPLFPSDDERALPVAGDASTHRAGPPARICFLTTLPRSGSWLLSDVLWATGLVGQPHEYFRPDFTDLWSAEWGVPPGAAYHDYVDAALSCTQSDNGVFCAKLHWYQFAWLRQQLAAETGTDADTAFAEWFPDASFVFLHRRDTARQAISYHRASRTQAWFDTGGTTRDRDDDEGFEVDLQQVRWFEDVLVDHRDRWRRHFDSHGIEPLEVLYEDLAADNAATVDRVLAHLGVDEPAPPLPAPRLRSQSDGTTERVLAAYRAARPGLLAAPDDLVWQREGRRFVSPGLAAGTTPTIRTEEVGPA